MKLFRRINFFIFTFGLLITLIYVENFEAVENDCSVLGLEKDEIYSEFDKYNMFKNIDAVEPSGAIISQEYFSRHNEIKLLESAQEIAGQEILKYLEDKKNDNIKYSQNNWLQKDIVISGTSTVFTSSTSLSKIKLPFQSSLSITGRKLMGFNYTQRLYDSQEDGKRQNSSSFKMEQEMQMRILGDVGDRFTVNIDYDDKAEKKDISLIYNGKPGEFIQQAAFGDIEVSLPTTEFTGYSKELFGLKVDTRYKNLGVNAFFSKTKGLSEVKRFVGNTQLERKLIPDTAYIKLKYYSLLKSNETRKIKNGTVKVYVAYQKLNPKYNFAIDSNVLLYDLNTTPGFSYKGNFVLLVAGQDFTIDYNTGVLAFKNSISKGDVAAVSYDFEDGTPLSNNPLIIKDINDSQNITTEIKTFYNLGNLKIIRDNGRGNFLLTIKDLNGSTPSIIDGGKNVPIYPPKPGYAANIDVDFENGIFKLPETLHDSLYLTNDHKYNFETEYQYTVKIVMLRPNIVPSSEKIVVDGVTLNPSIDYILDYDLGILTIKNENIIKENSVIDVSYDYSLLGAQAESMLLGVSSKLNLTENISIGAGMIHNFMTKSTVLPDIRNTPTSLSVGEGDLKIDKLDIDTLNMQLNLNAEYALSSYNENTIGKALIDSMDNSVREDSINILEDNWFHSADKYPTTRRMLSDLSWNSYEIDIKDIDPALEFADGQKQLVLELNYDVRYRSQIAFAQKICQNWDGLDFSKKLYLEVWIKDNNSNLHEMVIDCASCINEDSDGCGVLDTEDIDGTGILSPWKDVGRKFHNVDGTVSLIGAHNGKLDTEDLNGNGVLDTLEDIAGSYSLLSSSVTVIKQNINGWKQIRIPLDINDANRTNWKNIRILRIRMRQTNVGGDIGKIVIGKISIVGNKWEKIGLNADNFSISSIGRYDPTYKSILTSKYYLDLYGINEQVKKEENALKFSYNMFITNVPLLAKAVYTGNALDISKYDSICFMVYAKPAAGFAQAGDEIIFRACGNDGNYFEYKTIVSDDVTWQDWKIIRINQSGFGKNALWTSSDPQGQITVVGNPSLNRICQFVLGVKSNSVGEEHQIWFKELHAVGNKQVVGRAYKTAGDIKWNGTSSLGAISVGGSKKSINRDFQNIVAGVYNRDLLEEDAYISLGGFCPTEDISIFPIKTGISRACIITPEVIENKSNLISLNEEGRVITYTGYTQTNLNLGTNLPQISAKYIRSIIDTSKISRLEDRETLAGNIIYNNPIRVFLLPTNINADVKAINSYYKVYPSTPILESDSFLGLDKINDYLNINKYHTLEQSNLFAFRLPFKFFDGITFLPAYSLNMAKEKNNDFVEEIEYDKTLNQTAGASLVLGLANWFSPSCIYSITTKENYDISLSTSEATLTIPGQKKYIERNGVGEISWNLNACDIINLLLFKSLTFSTYYRLQDSDSYDKVNKDFKSIGFSMDRLWVRDNLLMDLEPFYSSNSYIVKTILNKDDIRFSGRYMPFEIFSFKGYFLPLNTFTTNCTYTQGNENSYDKGTRKTICSLTWPDILIGISKTEELFFCTDFLSDTQLNAKYKNKQMTTYGIAYSDSLLYGLEYRFKFIKILDLYVGLDNTDSKENDYITYTTLYNGNAQKYACQGAFGIGKWRFSIRYENECNWKKNASGKYVSNIQKNTYLGQINLDTLFPSGVKIPIIKIFVPLRNRIIFTSNLKYIDQQSQVNIERDNSTNFGASLNTDYEVSKYFRFIFGLIWDRFEFRYNKKLNYQDISALSKLTFQF
ncbi:MAG: hypothetical protein LBD57_03825 [Endomicrobium sp.]|jgi:hypothetical protein|uniref:hypothetical protein n=1 Tax=Candidatus Endomicrobiellum cubanum TaxID=3242325 RepID=UPI002825D297|nr:hypothetical protein [Endomicrobium sp.]